MVNPTRLPNVWTLVNNAAADDDDDDDDADVDANADTDTDTDKDSEISLGSVAAFLSVDKLAVEAYIRSRAELILWCASAYIVCERTALL